MRCNSGALAVILALAVDQVAAHTRVWSVWVNGKDQGDGRATYIRSPPTNSPVKDLTKAELACNVASGTPTTQFVTAAAGDTLSVEWYHDNRGDDIIDSSHKGPVMTYIADYTTNNGAGAIWTKIAEEGYHGDTKKWAVDNLIANKGKADVVLPATLAPGQYLMRQEIIALHEANALYTEDPSRGAQFYPSCMQLEVTGSGTTKPAENFDFNAGYTSADPGIHFNLYGTVTNYTIPGPKVWTGGNNNPARSIETCAGSTSSLRNRHRR